MLWNNALIQKELIQASHKRHLYLLRTLLAGFATIAMLLSAGIALLANNGDWRAIAMVSRPLFFAAIWVELIVFAVMASCYASASVRYEWTRKTMGVLLASPVSVTAVICGKFAGVVGRILMVALAVLPVMGVWFHFGRVPREVALGSMGVVTASTVLFGALGMLESAAAIPRGNYGGPTARLLVIYLAATVLLGLAPTGFEYVCIAAVPPWAMAYVLSATAPAGCTPAGFALLAVVLPLAFGLAAPVAAPFLFRRASNRVHGRTGALTPRKRKVRPPLGPDEDPIAWQERGRHPRTLMWVWCACYALAMLTLVLLATADPAFSPFEQPEVFSGLALLGASLLTLNVISGGTGVFAREKHGRTAPFLVLTGRSPNWFYKTKLRVLARATKPFLILVAAAFIPAIALAVAIEPVSTETVFGLVCMVGIGLLVPVCMTPTAIVFGVAARSPEQARGVMLVSPVLGAFGSLFFFPCLFMLPMLGAAVAACIIFVAVNKKWTAWRVGIVFVLTLLVFLAFTGAVGMISAMIGATTEHLTPFLALWGMVVAASGLGALWCLFWWRFGLHIFEGCMSGER